MGNKMMCRVCANNHLTKFLLLGTMPLANSFLSEKELLLKEKKFPLEICFCKNCNLVQLNYIVPKELMFKNYVYASSTTNTFREHFGKMAETIKKSFLLNETSLVVDIGCNDGVLLKGFKNLGTKVIGVEPAENIANIAKQNGIETINDFFSKSVAEKIIGLKGYADAVTATNVFAHVDNIKEFIENVKILLKKEGIFIIEVQYLVDMLEKLTFDNIYHEHLSYFSLISLQNFFKANGMVIFNVERVDTHGGSLRAFIKKSEGKYRINNAVDELLEYENRIGINNFETYRRFSDKVYHVRDKLSGCFKNIKSKGSSIAGYGAPAKGNTLLNFCQIGADYIDYIAEDNPLKIGLYTPGMHIPVLNSQTLYEKKPNYVLILAWNFAKEIMMKTKKLTEKGVKFIIPLPEPVIL